MKRNMGIIDRIVRTALAVTVGILIALGVLHGTLAIVLGIIGGVFLLTAIVGTCPIYLPFGISTKKKA